MKKSKILTGLVGVFVLALLAFGCVSASKTAVPTSLNEIGDSPVIAKLKAPWVITIQEPFKVTFQYASKHEIVRIGHAWTGVNSYGRSFRDGDYSKEVKIQNGISEYTLDLTKYHHEPWDYTLNIWVLDKNGNQSNVLKKEIKAVR